MLIRQLVAALVLSAFTRDVASLAAVVTGFGRLRALKRQNIVENSKLKDKP